MLTWISQNFVFIAYANQELFRKNFWGIGSTPFSWYELLPLSSVAFLFPRIDIKAIFPHFGQFSKRSSNFKHSYLSQMTTNIKNLFRSVIIQKYLNFDNFLFVAHVTLDQTGIIFWVTRYSKHHLKALLVLFIVQPQKAYQFSS